MANTYLTRTSGSPTNALKWTYSFWVKLKDVSNDIFLLDFNTDGNNRSNVGFFGSNGEFQVYEKVSGSTSQLVRTSRVFRDPNAWYHIVASCDRTLSTAADRTKIYVNGSRITSFASETQPTQNATGIINTAVNTLIGKYSDGSLYFSGSLAHVHFIDGTAYAASTFGETNSTSGIWVPKFAPSVSYGNNGFFLKFENSGAMGTDSSGNTNTFTPAGTLTQNTDSPTNNLVTLNSINPGSSITYSNGDTTFTNSSSGHRSVLSTFAVSTGKWYAEVKIGSLGGAYPTFGIFDSGDSNFNPATFFTATASGYGYNSNGAIYHNNSEAATGYATWTTGDIIGLALDATNNKIYVSKNGTFQNSANPATGTNGFSITADKTWYFAGHSNDGGTDPVQNFNFGSGFFGTTAVASANADANGHGAFEYAVPSGYYTLNTKNLKEFG
jgi:hypothetical protein